jgi:hypothetical protein
MLSRGLMTGVGTLRLACVLACSDDAPQPDSGPAQTSDELFSLDHLPRFDLHIDANAWAALEAEPRSWVPATFEYAGTEYPLVAVRLKGNHSFRPLGEKASFKLDFNEYVPGRRFLGLEGLTLNNMVVDSSMLREWISYRVFRELAVPAARAGFAQLWVNDEPYGLYLDLEPYDDEFLARVYADPSGNLYESDQSADLDTSLDAWHQDEGADHSLADLMHFAALAQQADNAVFYGDQAIVDMPEFLAFLAGEAIVGHFDGHMVGHNFFIYHEPTLDLWSYQPWGLDQALSRHVSPYGHQGYLGAKCMHDQACLVDYIERSQWALERLRGIDMAAEIEQAIALTDTAMREDPKRPYSAELVEASRQNARAYMLGRADELAPQLDCLVDGVEPDADNDGHGPCFQDCDEGDPAINPDAVELCDGIDNDCSGYIDDAPECECPSILSEDQTFYLCHHSLRWLDARDFCSAQGHELAYFDSAAQTSEVWAAAQSISAGRWAIGLNDRDEEEHYVWMDGSEPTFSLWAANEPAHALDWFDCVFLSNGAWVELNCIETGAFICR